MLKLKNNSDIQKEYRKINLAGGKTLRLLIVRPKDSSDKERVPGVLWIHGGGYVSGTPELLYSSRGIDLVTKCGAVVVSPAYSLSINSPYPEALRECHQVLVYMKNHADELGIRPDQIIVGGESAGGGMTSALCMYAHDHHSVNIAFQLPLYPMLDCHDTPTSSDNHEKIWNTAKNHMAWKLYLRRLKNRDNISCYASPARRNDYTGLPPCFTFVGIRDPFLYETIEYVKNLREAGVEAYASVYRNCEHAFDMMQPDSEEGINAARKFVTYFNYACKKYRAPQEGDL